MQPICYASKLCLPQICKVGLPGPPWALIRRSREFLHPFYYVRGGEV